MINLFRDVTVKNQIAKKTIASVLLGKFSVPLDADVQIAKIDLYIFCRDSFLY